MALLSTDLNSAAVLFAVLVAVTVWVIARGVAVARAAAALPRPAERTPEERAIARKYRRIVIAEVAAFAIVNPLLAFAGYSDVLPAANLIIVGVHFIPLARLFNVPRYTALGIVFCVVPTAVLIGVPSTTQIGDAGAWFVLPAAICGSASVAVGWAGVAEARSIVRS